MKQALVGGTVADVYTGTWIEANVEFEDGVITYVGPREPARRGDRRHRQGPRARLHRAAHAPVVPVLADVAARGRRARRDDDARLRQPVLLPLARRRRAAHDRRRDARRARARPLGGADLAAVGLPGRGRALRDRARSRRCCRGRRWWPAARSRTGCRSRAASRGWRRGSPRPRRRAGASRATTPAPPTTASTSSRAAGISSDHEAITGAEALDRLRLGHVDDAAPVLAAAGSRAGCCSTGCTRSIAQRAAADVHHRRRHAVASTPSAA